MEAKVLDKAHIGTPLPLGRFTVPTLASAESRMRAVHSVHAETLMRFLMRLALGERQLAEELFQETMLRAWRAIDRFPHDWESQRRWLWTVARRVSIDVARASRVRPTEVNTVDPARIPASGNPADAVIAAEVIRQALPKLSDEHRTVLVDIYFHGLAIAEVATRLGVPVGTVKSRAHYALRSLRRIIGPLDGD